MRTAARLSLRTVGTTSPKKTSRYAPYTFHRGPPANHPQTSSGSSSGPAVSISAGFAPLAIATETSGSVVFPACANGVYGLKLTRGAVPTDGVFTLSRSWDCVGAMARAPADLAPLAEALTGRRDLGAAVDAGRGRGLFEGLRMGVVRSTWGVDRAWSKGKWEEPGVVSCDASSRWHWRHGLEVVTDRATT